MTKKKFREKSKKEKRISYKLMVIGGTIAVLSLLLIVSIIVFVKDPTSQVVYLSISSGFAILGGIIDILGELILDKEYKAEKAKSKK